LEKSRGKSVLKKGRNKTGEKENKMIRVSLIEGMPDRCETGKGTDVLGDTVEIVRLEIPGEGGELKTRHGEGEVVDSAKSQCVRLFFV